MRSCNGVGRGFPCPLGEHTTTFVVIVCYNYIHFDMNKVTIITDNCVIK